MHDLTAITPLGQPEPLDMRIGAFALREICDFELASFAARLGAEATAKAALSKLIEADPPGPGQSAGTTMRALWTGPEQWVIEAASHAAPGLVRHAIKAAGASASVTDQTDAWCRFDVSGDDLNGVFALLCPIDMRDWVGGETTRTTIDHIGCIVLRRDPRLVSVYGPRSFAASLNHALVTAMRVRGG